MPGLDGLELQAALAAAGRDESIIFITGHGDIPTCANAMKAGAIDFLPKPFRDEDLLDAIARSLKRSQVLRREHTERTKIQILVDQLTPRDRTKVQYRLLSHRASILSIGLLFVSLDCAEKEAVAKSLRKL
jgi:FixJ family two-component response regulator